VPVSATGWVKKWLNFPYFLTPLANFLLSRPNSVEYGNSKTTTLLRPLFQGQTGCGGRPSGWHDIVTCQHLVDFTGDEQLMSVYIYILMTYLKGTDQLKTIDQWEWRMIGHVIDIERVKLVKASFEHLVIKSPYLHTDFKEVVIRSLIVRSDSCDWRCGRIWRWSSRVQCETPVVRRTSFPSTVVGNRSWTRDVFILKIASRWQSVNQWKSTTTATSSESEDSGSTKQIATSWDEHC